MADLRCGEKLLSVGVLIYSGGVLKYLEISRHPFLY